MVDDDDPNALFEILLTWLNPNRDEAWKEYETVRATLIKIFSWRKCRNAEDLANEVFNRVEQKMPGLMKTYEGDPKRYFYGVAQNVVHEYWRDETRFSELQEEKTSADSPVVISEHENHRQECLRRCLAKVSKKDRELIMKYYQSEKKAKLSDRKQLAKDLGGITMNALWIRVSRIRSFLATCIRECLQENRLIR